MSFKKIDTNDTSRPEGKTCILVYGYNEDELKNINTFASTMGIKKTIEISNKKAFHTLGELIEESKKEHDEESKHTDKAIVLNAISEFELNNFLSNFKNANVKRPLFAVVTENSIKWRFHDLLDDLIEERQRFMEMRKKQLENSK